MYNGNGIITCSQFNGWSNWRTHKFYYIASNMCQNTFIPNIGCHCTERNIFGYTMFESSLLIDGTSPSTSSYSPNDDKIKLRSFPFEVQMKHIHEFLLYEKWQVENLSHNKEQISIQNASCTTWIMKVYHHTYTSQTKNRGQVSTKVYKCIYLHKHPV